MFGIKLVKDDEVSIPQAVSTIAIILTHFSLFLFLFYIVSIPQAVSTIAIASDALLKDLYGDVVSIPQAVSTIAITAHSAIKALICARFQYRKR